ncbi:MAG TPA: ABC transporter substrate-binding protein [Xanthobacteraceae bacterium]|jgi:ABC-type nitrate/sulfonate/bicarbonate transport system substrate-binding protein|nr:ABC transporter substrate-binding protein [Xanthobacteraceae bacterium]
MLVLKWIHHALVIGAISLGLLGTNIPAQAQALEPVSVIVFPGGFNWPIWVAQEKGYFTKGGIEVKLTYTPNSVFQLTGLIDGKFDIGVTAVDNVVAYMEGQGEAPVTREPDLFVFMGGDNGLLSLTTLPEIKSYQGLKGKTLSVDAATTGYAFVLFDLLKRNGLASGDYTFEKAGGVLARWEAMKEHKHAGTILLSPFDLIAKAAGFNVLQYAIDVYGHYQGLVSATRRSWAQDHKRQLDSYVRGYLAGLQWLYDPNNKAEAIAVLRKNLPQMSAELANESYGVLVGPKGFDPKAAMDIEGFRRVLALRSEYGEPKKQLTDPMKYYDPTYYDAAAR